MDTIDDLRIHEDLHLSIGAGRALFVPEEITAKLARHQIDGLRFLYRQFTKKKPGVILNDPSGYGKKAQITIFLNVIKHVVTQPVLVLCNQTDMPKWRHNFGQWTDADNDIIYESSTPYTNKKIFVNTFDFISDFSRQDWSVVVVDDPVSLKLFKPLRILRSAFRIWIVSIDLKAHFNTFEAIHDWVRPSTAFPRQMFVADKTNIQDVVEKAIALDSYFEDIVLRRGISQLGESQPDPIFKPVTKVSRKNKDPSGTKVKRSKKRINDETINIKSTNKCYDETKVDNKRNINDDDDESVKINRNKIYDDEDNDIQITKRNRRMILDDDDDNEFTMKNDETTKTNHDCNEIKVSITKNDENNENLVNHEENCINTSNMVSTESSQEMRLHLDLGNHNENEMETENKEITLNQRMNETEFESGTKVENYIKDFSAILTNEVKKNKECTKGDKPIETCKKLPDFEENNSISSSTKENDSESNFGKNNDVEIANKNDNIKVEINTEQVVSIVNNNKEKQFSNDSNSSDVDVFSMTENILTNVFFCSPNSKKVNYKSEDKQDINKIKNDGKDEVKIDETKEIKVNCDTDDFIKSEKDKLDELQTSILDSLF